MRKGFTLIELLVVIAIIAILAGVVLTGVTGFQANARDTRRIGDLRNIQLYMEQYYAQCDHYPGVTTGNCAATITSWSDLEGELETRLNVKVPNDPVAGRSYSYGYDAPESLTYVLAATLEKDNRTLQDDLDGTVLGVECDDRVYCVGS